MSGLVGSILGSKLRSKFADPQETKEPKGRGCPEHQMIVFSGGLSPTSAACVPAFPGFFFNVSCFSMEWESLWLSVTPEPSPIVVCPKS